MENTKHQVTDFGLNYISIYAATDSEATQAATSYTESKYPGVRFTVEKGLTGKFGGAVITGVVHILRAKGAIQ